MFYLIVLFSWSADECMQYSCFSLILKASPSVLVLKVHLVSFLVEHILLSFVDFEHEIKQLLHGSTCLT